MATIFYYPNTNRATYVTNSFNVEFENVTISRDANKLWLIDINRHIVLLETNNFTVITRYDEPGSDL